MDWSVQLLIAGAAIAIISSILTLVTQHILALRVDNILRARSRQSRQAVSILAPEQPDTDTRLRIAHELGDLRIESIPGSQENRLGQLMVVRGDAAIGQIVPLYEENWIKVTKHSKVDRELLNQMPAEYQAALVYEGDEFVIYGTCPLHTITVNDVPITGGYQRRVRLNAGDVLHFDTETILQYGANSTYIFRIPTG